MCHRASQEYILVKKSLLQRYHFRLHVPDRVDSDIITIRYNTMEMDRHGRKLK
jgi:hypothetical protein